MGVPLGFATTPDQAAPSGTIHRAQAFCLTLEAHRAVAGGPIQFAPVGWD